MAALVPTRHARRRPLSRRDRLSARSHLCCRPASADGLACLRALKRSPHFCSDVLPLGALLLAWELVARTGFVNAYVFPPISAIVIRWVSLFVDGSIFAPLGATLWRALAGLGAAIVIGAPLGLLMGRTRWAQWFFEPLFSFFFPLPKIALIPLYVHLFGLFSFSKVMLIFTDCLFPIVIFTYHGARGVSPIYLWSAQARGTSHVRMFLACRVPAVAGLALRRHPGRRRRGGPRGCCLRDDIRGRRSRSRHDARLSLRRRNVQPSPSLLRSRWSASCSTKSCKSYATGCCSGT